MKISKLKASWLIGFLLVFNQQIEAQAIPVTVVKNTNGSFQLLRGGQPYYVKGAGVTDIRLLKEVAKRGGNSARTWDVGAPTKAFLDTAHAHGVSVLVGIYVGHESAGFNYDDTARVRRQFETYRNWVLTYKDHPAVLAWGVGNEMEAGARNMKVWDAINDIAKMIHELDGKHPTLTVTAGTGANLLRTISERAPEIDMVGINIYGGIGGVRNVINNSVWTKPYMITEWGTNGHWEVSQTTWKEYIEPSAATKAEHFLSRYQEHIKPNADRCLGSYCFVFSGAVTKDYTHYNMWVGLEPTPSVEIMQFNWTGSYPVNRAPVANNMRMNGVSALVSLTVRSIDTENEVEVFATDAENDSLTYEFLFRPKGAPITATDALGTVPTIPNLITSRQGKIIKFKVTSEMNNGNYILYCFVRDGKGGVSSINFPFRVELTKVVYTEARYNTPIQDAYVRSGAFATQNYGVLDSTQLILKAREEGFYREAYLQFDLATIREDFDTVYFELFGGRVKEALISVWGNNRDNWNENTVNFSTRLLPTTEKLDEVTLWDNTDRFYRWNVTSFIKNNLRNRVSKLSLIVRNENELPNTPTTWISTEGSPFPPRLNFSFNGRPLTTSTQDVRNQDTINNIYPNPAQTTLTIEWLDKVLSTKSDKLELTLTHLNGQVIKVWSVQNAAVLLLDIHDLPRGVYFIKGEMGGNVLNRRFVKM
jgi:hypothetical protein